jgi:methylmalonyl-CoA/ethylmalonyl-CoA epimerase
MANIKRIDHVAIAVKDVDQAVAQYQGLLNATHVRTETLREKAGMVRVAYMQIGENILSLVQSLEPDGFIHQHIARHGEGLHHLGLEVDDLEGFIAQTEARGYKIPLRDEFSNRDEVVLRGRAARRAATPPRAAPGTGACRPAVRAMGAGCHHAARPPVVRWPAPGRRCHRCCA